jgi:hypothetical protein
VPQEVSERVRVEWSRRIEAEYRSAALTQQLTLWLTQMAASPDLIRAGLRITSDELHHAALSHKVARAAGAGGITIVTIDRGQLELPRQGALEDDVLHACVAIFCLGETVAVPLFRALREPCTVPSARKALDRILRDEVRHRDFGWTLLAWLIECDGGRRDKVQRDLPSMVKDLLDSYGKPTRERPLSDEERAWGLMPARDYKQILIRSLERDHRPRFARLQIKI